MRLKKVVVRLEIGHHINLALVTGPAQVENDQRQEFHHVERGRHSVALITQEHWLYCLLSEECALFEFHNSSSIASPSFGEYQEW